MALLNVESSSSPCLPPQLHPALAAAFFLQALDLTLPASGDLAQGLSNAGSRWGGICGPICGLFFVLLLFALPTRKLRAACVPSSGAVCSLYPWLLRPRPNPLSPDFLDVHFTLFGVCFSYLPPSLVEPGEVV